jgi:ribosome-associated protein
MMCAEASLEKKGENVIVLDLRDLTSTTDFFVICSGRSDVHIKAIADNVVDVLKSKGVRVWHKEGYESRRWVLLDYVDVVVHVFRPETREYYALERLWADAPLTEVSLETSD